LLGHARVRSACTGDVAYRTARIMMRRVKSSHVSLAELPYFTECYLYLYSLSGQPPVRSQHSHCMAVLQHWASSSRSSSHRAAASLVFEGSETANPRRDYESSKLQSGPSNPISIPLPPLLSPQSSNFLLLLEPILSSFTILRYPHRPPIPSTGWFILRTPLRPRLQPDTPLCDSPAKVLTTNQQRISLLRPRAYKLTWTFNRRFAFWPASSRTISSSRLLSTLQIHVIRPSFDSGHGSHAFLETQVSELKLRIPSLSSSLRASDISVLDKRFNPSTHKLPAPS
jgi:hypothetical protein